MSTQKTISIVLGTVVVLALVLATLIALLVYLPPGGEEKQRAQFDCPEEQFTVMCVVRGYIAPSIDRS